MLILAITCSLIDVITTWIALKYISIDAEANILVLSLMQRVGLTFGIVLLLIVQLSTVYLLHILTLEIVAVVIFGWAAGGNLYVLYLNRLILKASLLGCDDKEDSESA